MNDLATLIQLVEGFLLVVAIIWAIRNKSTIADFIEGHLPPVLATPPMPELPPLRFNEIAQRTLPTASFVSQAVATMISREISRTETLRKLPDRQLQSELTLECERFLVSAQPSVFKEMALAIGRHVGADNPIEAIFFLSSPRNSSRPAYQKLSRALADHFRGGMVDTILVDQVQDQHLNGLSELTAVTFSPLQNRPLNVLLVDVMDRGDHYATEATKFLQGLGCVIQCVVTLFMPRAGSPGQEILDVDGRSVSAIRLYAIDLGKLNAT